jgi:hypothetical protein
MSSTPREASSTSPQPSSVPTVDEEATEDSEDLDKKLDLVATRSPI